MSRTTFPLQPELLKEQLLEFSQRSLLHRMEESFKLNDGERNLVHRTRNQDKLFAALRLLELHEDKDEIIDLLL